MANIIEAFMWKSNSLNEHFHEGAIYATTAIFASMVDSKWVSTIIQIMAALSRLNSTMVLGLQVAVMAEVHLINDTCCSSKGLQEAQWK